ncbi:MAG: hypothetical protein K6G62_02775 [Eubacterium sp.]|nr:hypothetical protein [Eubacterium sp.]
MKGEHLGEWLVLILIGGIFLGGLQFLQNNWISFGLVEDSKRVSLSTSFLPKGEPVMDCLEAKCVRGEEFCPKKLLKARDFDGRDLTDQVEIRDESGRVWRQGDVLEKEGCYQLSARVKSPVTGLLAEKKWTFLVDGRCLI